MAVANCVAVDLGASSARVILGRVDSDRVELDEVHRVPNGPVHRGDRLCWNFPALYAGILDGLRASARVTDVDGIGVDSWGVDYGLLDADGTLLGDVMHYRDSRTDGRIDQVAALVPPDEHYRRTGIQFMPINTVYQLAAEHSGDRLIDAHALLLVPDLVGHWLTGTRGVEITNASTTALLDVHTGDWCWELIDRLALPRHVFPPLRRPGSAIGPLRTEVAADVGLPAGVELLAVGSHDTASAVAAVPAVDDRFAYISCGTWSLVGVELTAPVLTAPVLTAASLAANFTNERGVDDTIRYLRNVMGNVLVQATTLRGARDLGELRRLVATSQSTTRYEPRHTLATQWASIDASVPRHTTAVS